MPPQLLQAMDFWWRNPSPLAQRQGLPVLSRFPGPSATVALRKVTCHHDGADVGVPQEANHGCRLRFEDVFHDEEPQEGQAALHRVPGGIHRAGQCCRRHKAEGTSWDKQLKSHLGLLEDGLGWNSLLAARAAKHPVKCSEQTRPT